MPSRIRYRHSSKEKVLRLERWIVMTLDWVAAHYCITKSDLLRSLIQWVDRKTELVDPAKQWETVAFFEDTILLCVRLGDRNEQLLEDIAKHLDLSLGDAIKSIVLTNLDNEVERLEKQKPRASTLEILRHRQIYISEELADALYTLRDQRGESVSLLLKEAIGQCRTRTVAPLPLYRKERNVNLRLTSQEWEKLDMLAASSGMESSEAVASLLVSHYFSE